MTMQGLSIASLKKHKALIPLFVCVAFGGAGALFYTLRLATRNPDVGWIRSPDRLSNDDWAKKQYKFYSPNIDVSKIEDRAPKYKD